MAAKNGADKDDITITVDLDVLTLGDLETIETLTDGSAKAVDMLDFLSRIIVEPSDIRSIPLRMLPQVVKAVQSQMSEMSNPENLV